MRAHLTRLGTGWAEEKTFVACLQMSGTRVLEVLLDGSAAGTWNEATYLTSCTSSFMLCSHDQAAVKTAINNGGDCWQVYTPWLHL